MPTTPTEPPRVLLAYDGSDAAASAICAAAGLMPGARAIVAHARDAAIALEHAALARLAMPDSVIVGSALAYEREVEDASRKIAERGRSLAEAAGLEATVLLSEGSSAWRAICFAGREQRADLIACGSRGLGGVARALLGSTSSALVHHADRPVLVVPPGTGQLTGPVLIGYDGSDGAKAAIATAARLLPGSETLVVHAWPSSIRNSFVGETLLAAPVAEIREVTNDLDEALAEAAEEIAAEGAAIAAEKQLNARSLAIPSTASAWRTLAATARDEAAAVVVAGCRGRGALASTVLGSVSSGLVHNADMPVLIVRGTRA
jgi:nucleotide-binding universal stress UspA family protein